SAAETAAATRGAESAIRIAAATPASRVMRYAVQRYYAAAWREDFKKSDGSDRAGSAGNSVHPRRRNRTRYLGFECSCVRRRNRKGLWRQKEGGVVRGLRRPGCQGQIRHLATRRDCRSLSRIPGRNQRATDY